MDAVLMNFKQERGWICRLTGASLASNEIAPYNTNVPFPAGTPTKVKEGAGLVEHAWKNLPDTCQCGTRDWLFGSKSC